MNLWQFILTCFTFDLYNLSHCYTGYSFKVSISCKMLQQLMVRDSKERQRKEERQLAKPELFAEVACQETVCQTWRNKMTSICLLTQCMTTLTTVPWRQPHTLGKSGLCCTGEKNQVEAWWSLDLDDTMSGGPLKTNNLWFNFKEKDVIDYINKLKHKP